MSSNDLQIAMQACEERKVELLMTVCPQIIVPNSLCPTFDKNGIKMEMPYLLHIAAFSGAYDCVKFLIQYDANVQAMDANDRSVLYIATIAGYTQIVNLLLENGADPNQKDKNSWTPLHRAALWGHIDIARLLIEHGANVNVCEEI